MSQFLDSFQNLQTQFNLTGALILPVAKETALKNKLQNIYN